MHFENKKNTQ
ncbi:hypothetical protein ECTW14313_1302, partial [Escherichia coli O157:H7 str. TW14313]